MRYKSGAVAGIDADGLIRRQKMTTWGILGLALFVSVGMAEWSKRFAVSEVVVDGKTLQQAMRIATAAVAVNVKVNVNENLGGELPNLESGKQISDFGFRNSDSGKNLSDLGVSAVKSLATVNVKVNENLGGESRVAGGELPATSNPKHATLRSESVATMQTSAGLQK